jgi:hypothetical protein
VKKDERQEVFLAAQAIEIIKKYQGGMIVEIRVAWALTYRRHP